MLKIIMGSEQVHKYTDKRLIEFPGNYFNEMKKQDWFEDKFVQKIIKEIDKAYIELGFSVRSIEYGDGYSVNDLSGGAKTLILMHKLRNKMFLAMMGDNCTDLLEQIAISYEKTGQDLIIVENYLHQFKFNYIDSIHYINWGITCKSLSDINNLVKRKWYKQEDENKTDDEPTEAEIEQMNDTIDKLMNGGN